MQASTDIDLDGQLLGKSSIDLPIMDRKASQSPTSKRSLAKPQRNKVKLDSSLQVVPEAIKNSSYD